MNKKVPWFLSRKAFLLLCFSFNPLAEGLSETFIKDHVAMGEIFISCNPRRKNQKITGIGTGLRTKVNASIGTSHRSEIQAG